VLRVPATIAGLSKSPFGGGFLLDKGIATAEKIAIRFTTEAVSPAKTARVVVGLEVKSLLLVNRDADSLNDAF
jgi:hypothetical protein